jgi:hypothetical protein
MMFATIRKSLYESALSLAVSVDYEEKIETITNSYECQHYINK